MLERILPEGVAVASTAGDLDVPLFPEEEAMVSRAVEKRRREFVTARACARQALGQLGVPEQAIPAGAKGEPRWPAGVVGSITHCAGYRACALARATDLLTIGVDAERDEPLPDGLLADVALPEERRRMRGLEAVAPGVSWDRLLFSIKEAVYKAWFPLARRWLGFEDATVAIDGQRGTFSARLLVPGPSVGGAELTDFSGRWLAEGGLLFAAIAVPAGASPAASANFAPARERVDD
ncbi:MAG: 4'-phosphopantetheinyl transferase family protein [Solirubrobacterales bacterium]